MTKMWMTYGKKHNCAPFISIKLERHQINNKVFVFMFIVFLIEDLMVLYIHLLEGHR